MITYTRITVPSLWRNLETFDQRIAREEKERKSRKGRKMRWLMDKQSKLRGKNRRLLARMAPELELAKKKRPSSPWSRSIDLSPRGGIYFMGFAKAGRQHDTRRTRVNDSGIRGPRTIRIEGDPLIKIRERRCMLGNRNGSEKVRKDRESEQNKQLPRAAHKQTVLLETLEQLAAEEELEIERWQEEVRRQIAEEEALAREETWWRDWLKEEEDPPWSEE